MTHTTEGCHWTEKYYAPGDVRVRGDFELYFQPKRISAEVEQTLKSITEYGTEPETYLNLACGPNVQCLRELLEELRLLRFVCGDLNPSFVSYLEEQFYQEPVTKDVISNFLMIDMREDFQPGETFDLISIYGNSFGFFDHTTNFNILERCYRKLNPKGLLVVTTVDFDHMCRFSPSNPLSWENVLDSEEGEMVRQSVRYFLPKENKSVCEYVTRQGSQILESGSRDLMIYPLKAPEGEVSLSTMAKQAGFSRLRAFNLPENDQTFGLMRKLQFNVFEK